MDDTLAAPTWRTLPAGAFTAGAAGAGAGCGAALDAFFLAEAEVLDVEALLALTVFCDVERGVFFALARRPHGKLAGTKAAEASK